MNVSAETTGELHSTYQKVRGAEDCETLLRRRRISVSTLVTGAKYGEPAHRMTSLRAMAVNVLSP